MTKIMLVEDDRSLRDIYHIRLAAEGYSIALASDGEEALSVVVQEKPDLIIADVMMPKISGFDMLDILRSQPETKNIKVIVMTALSSEEQRQRGEALGAEKYLVKSQVGIEDVINAVHEVLGDAPNANAQTNIRMAKVMNDVESANRPAAPANAVPATNAPVSTATPNAAPAVPNAVPVANPTSAAAPTPTSAPAATNPPASPAAANPAASTQAAPVTASPTPMPTPAPAPAPQNPAPAMPTANPAVPPNTMPPNPPAQNGAPPANFEQAPAAMPANPTPDADQNPAQVVAGATPTQDDQTYAAAPAAMPQQVYAQMPIQSPIPVQITVQTQSAAPSEPQAIPATPPKERGANERIIQPLSDPTLDTQRDEMQKRMEEMLGQDTLPAQPETINTQTAAQNPVVAPEAPTAPAPTETTTPTEAPAPPTEPANTVDAKETAEINKAETTEDVPAPGASTPTEVQQPSLKTSAAAQAATGIEQVTADTEIPSIDEIEDPGVDVTVKAAVPGYLSDLTEELSNDLASETELDPNSMEARMRAELSTDEVTAAAEAKAAAEIAARQAEAEALAETPTHQVKQTASNSPNIHNDSVAPSDGNSAKPDNDSPNNAAE